MTKTGATKSYKSVRLGTFEGDAGKAPFPVSRSDLATALGLEGHDPSNAVGLGLRAVLSTVSQPVVRGVDGVDARVDERVTGEAGAAMLADGFGRGSLRTLWIDHEALSAALDDADVLEAFGPFFDASERRLAARDARFGRLVAASRAKAEARRAATPEAIAA